MKVEFVVSAGLHFREVEIVEYEDDVDDKYLAEQYNTWVCEQIDGGWTKINEVTDD